MISSVFNKLRQSLATRLLLLFFVMSLLITALLVGSMFHAIGAQWRHGIAPHIEQYLDYVNEDLGYPPDQQRANELAAKLPINIYVEGPDTAFSTNGRALQLEDLEFKQRRKIKKNYQQGNLPQVFIGEHHERTVLRNQTGEYNIYYELQHREASDRRGRSLLIPITLLALILGGCYLLLRRMLRPVQDIKQAVRVMGSGQLETRVPVRTNNDLGTLATSINVMASDIEKLLDAKRQLLLGASHELRTPITRAKVAAQMLTESANRERIIEDLDEMESLIADIIESERVTGGHSALKLTQVNVQELITAAIQESGTTTVTTELPATLPHIQADATRLRLLIRNLLNNALSHGGSDIDQAPLIAATSDGQTMTISITDYGDGIAAEHLSKLTEAFYRADPSRARHTGGFGLGLHICDLIVQAHNGTLEINNHTADNGEPAGVKVTVQLPIRQLQRDCCLVN